jgi:hypothetical protein
MKYKRFKQLWDALVTNRVRSEPAESVSHGTPMSRHTQDALIAYGKGEPSAFDNIKDRIAEARRGAFV